MCHQTEVMANVQLVGHTHATVQLNGILAHHCDKSIEEIEQATDRDYFMSAAQACEYGIIDEVITHKKNAGEDGN